MLTDTHLEAFVRESWKIEGLTLGSSVKDVMDEHRLFLALPKISLSQLAGAAALFTNGYGRLRELHGMNVQVGNHVAPAGGSELIGQLNDLVWVVNGDMVCGSSPADMTPYAIHHWFETLHPFMDGNGRTGRLLWAWMMERCTLNRDRDPYWPERGFLHTWYYQSLGAGR